MYGVDTRALTKKLRVHGSMKGKIVMDEVCCLVALGGLLRHSFPLGGLLRHSFPFYPF